MTLKLSTGLAALALCVAPLPVLAQKVPENWDGLVKVKAKHVDLAYLRPQADFRGYTKVLIDPTEVAFRKNWQRDLNADTSTRISDADARKILDEAQAGFQKLFAEAYRKAGYEVVTTAGPDVLRLSTGVLDIEVEAPDEMSPGITRTYTREAGGATLVVEARDSLSGSLLGRAIDGRLAGDGPTYLRNRATNEGDFERLFRDWAERSAKGLTELKALSPIDANGKLRK